jgi:hypothetical protein
MKGDTEYDIKKVGLKACIFMSRLY